jgi:hypothetical protein
MGQGFGKQGFVAHENLNGLTADGADFADEEGSAFHLRHLRNLRFQIQEIQPFSTASRPA